MAIFSGFTSVTRYFIEGLAVQEQRCLPSQSGFTIDPTSVNFPLQLNSFSLVQLAQNSRSVVQRSCYGWYWGVLPALFVGITIRFLAGGVIHISDRSKQAKKPLWNDLMEPKEGIRTKKVLGIYLLVLLLLFILSCWLILANRGSTGILSASDLPSESLAFLANENFANFSSAS